MRRGSKYLSTRPSGAGSTQFETCLAPQSLDPARDGFIAGSLDRWDGCSRVSAMIAKDSLEQTATSIAALDRDELQRRIKGFRGRFKLDFTEDYLNSLTVDRLRHILLAALINAQVHV